MYFVILYKEHTKEGVIMVYSTITLVEKHQINQNNPFYKEIDDLGFLAKNLYNATLYTVRQNYILQKTYLNYYKMNRLFIDENQVDYRALPAKVSQKVQQLVDKNFQSFFKLLKLKQKGQYTKHIKIPNYLHKQKGRQVLHYEKGALSFRDEGYIKLSRTGIKIKTQLTKEQVQFVRLIHKNGYKVIEIGYKTVKRSKKTENINKYASIDLGLNNLMTVTSTEFSPLIYNGRPLKSINHYYNKRISKLKGKLPNNHYTSKQIEILYRKRQNKIETYLHQTSRQLVNQLVSKGVGTLVIGYNPDWKQDINLGKVSNQNFVQIPFLTLVNQIKYKCELEGIEVVIQEESYTSKCSFIDLELVKNHDIYVGKRVHRGLFKSSRGRLLNADVNGSLNILHKYLGIEIVNYYDQLIQSIDNVKKVTYNH